MRSLSPTTPSGYTIFCDDVRQEVGGKVSLMGIYAASIEISSPLPFTLPKFCFAITYIERPGESEEPVELRIYLPDDEEGVPTFRLALPVEQMRGQVPPIEPSDLEPLIRLQMNTTVAPLVLKQTGRISVRAYRGDLEIKLGTILVNAPPAEVGDKPATDNQTNAENSAS